MPPRPVHPSLARQLRAILQKADRLAVLAVGSELRGDDAAGLLAGQELQRLAGAAEGPAVLEVFLGGTAPENLTGPIKAFRPTHLIVIDAAEMGRPPGCVQVIDPSRVADTGSFCTHSLPLNVLTGYLREALGCQAVIIAIQPASCEFGQPVCRSVATAARRVARAILMWHCSAGSAA